MERITLANRGITIFTVFGLIQNTLITGESFCNIQFDEAFS